MATDTLDPAVAAPAARILIVDDERSMREMLGILLAPRGARCRRGRQRPPRYRVPQPETVRPRGVRRADARHRRARGAPARPEDQSVGDRDHDHRVRIAGPDQGGRTARRHRLRRKAVQHRGPQVPHPQGARAAPPAAGKRAAQARDALGESVRQHHRQQQRDGAGVRNGRDRRADRQHGARHRRVGDGQGTGGARDPRPIARAASGRSWRSTAGRCRRRCSIRSCSATCADRSPAPTRTGRA